jgi:hypothetical protein
VTWSDEPKSHFKPTNHYGTVRSSRGELFLELPVGRVGCFIAVIFRTRRNVSHLLPFST